MNICVLGLRGLPDVMGGVEMHCEQLFPLMKEMKERRPNHSFTIIGRRAYLPRRVCEYHGLRVISLPHARSKYFETITNTIYGIIYARVTLRSDLLHLHGIGPALVAPIVKMLGMKVVVTYHSKNYEHRRWNRAARLILRIGEFCAVAFADRVIVVSRCMARDLRRRFPWAAGKLYFIPNGANHVDSVRSEMHRDEAVLGRYGLERNNYIVSVGRLVPEKGFHDLLEAFERSDFRGKVVIVGDADHRGIYSDRLLEKAGDRFVPSAPMRQIRRVEHIPAEMIHYGMPRCARKAASFAAFSSFDHGHDGAFPQVSDPSLLFLPASVTDYCSGKPMHFCSGVDTRRNIRISYHAAIHIRMPIHAKDRRPSQQNGFSR